MSISDALAAFAESPTTTVIIVEIKTDAIFDSDVCGLRHPRPLDPSISRRLSLSKKPLL
jgi:hypothetical protein